jgi:hypothetical protein
MLTSQARIEAALRRITTEGGDGNFVIVTTGGYYVQFAGEPGASEIHMEAVGNAYLDGDAMLSPDQERALSELGFATDPPSNWTLDSPVNPDSLRELAALAVAILRDVYGASSVEIELTIELGDRWRPDDAAMNSVLEGGDQDEITLMLREATLLLPAPSREERFVDEGDGVVVVTGYDALESWKADGMGQYAVPGADLFGWLWERGVRRVVVNPGGPGRTEVDEGWLSRLAGIQ